MPDPSSTSPANGETPAAPGAQESLTHRQAEDAVRVAVNRERQRLAGLLHQTASQSLTAAYYSALVLSRQTPPDAADLAALPDLIHTAITELREIAQEFRESEAGTPSP